MEAGHPTRAPKHEPHLSFHLTFFHSSSHDRLGYTSSMPPRRNLVALKTRDTLTNLVDPHSTASAAKSRAMAARPRKRTVVEDIPFPDFTPSSQVKSKPSSSSPPAKKRKPLAQKTARRTSARSSSPLSSPSSPPRIATQTSLTLAASGSHKTSTTFVEDDEDDEPFASVFDILMGPPAGPSRSQTLEAKDEPKVPVFRPTTLPPGWAFACCKIMRAHDQSRSWRCGLRESDKELLAGGLDWIPACPYWRTEEVARRPLRR